MIKYYKQYIAIYDKLTVYEFGIVYEIHTKTGKDIRTLINEYSEFKQTKDYILYNRDLRYRYEM